MNSKLPTMEVKREMRPPHTGTYLLTHHLSSTIPALQQCGLSVPQAGHSIYDTILSELITLMELQLPNCDIKVLQMDDMSHHIIHAAREEFPGAMIVSTCPTIAYHAGSFAIEINRIVDLDGNILGIGPRPGHQPIHIQLDALKRLSNDGPVVIVEDGIFSGRTIAQLFDWLKAAQVNVVGVIAGFRFEKSKEVLEPKGIPVLTIAEYDNLVDWLPDHDFLPLTPSNGRVVGVKMQNLVVPLYDYKGASFCIPYLDPFAPVKEWASFTGDRTSLAQFAHACISMSLHLYEIIQEMNRKAITIADLLKVQPRISVPVQAGNSENLVYSHESDVRRYLHSMQTVIGRSYDRD